MEIVATDKPDERRRAPRVDTSIRATVTSGKRKVPFVIDSISTSGARLIGELALALKERIGILFEAEAQRIDVIAEVVRVDTADLMTDQIAVRFLDPSPDTMASLRVLVDRSLDEYWSSDSGEEKAAPDAEVTGPSTRIAPEDEDTEVVIVDDD